ncbi:MAG: HlyD family secretion protein [Flavobacteriales bacterium]|nr:HlyD family secretion protein [Flavobacteriales bacterium]
MILDVPVKGGQQRDRAQQLQRGATVATIADMTDLIFQGKVDESEVGKVKLGMPVSAHRGCHRERQVGRRVGVHRAEGCGENGAIQFEIRAVKLKEGQSLRSGVQVRTRTSCWRSAIVC